MQTAFAAHLPAPAETWDHYLAHRRSRIGRVFLILPAYNEEACLGNLLTRLTEFQRELRTPLTVCVIDDGSTDGTRDIARQEWPELELMLIEHPRNLGLGQAMQTGLRTAARLAEDHDAIIAMDADDTHDVRLIARIIDALEHGGDIAIASRFVDGGSDVTAPPFRRLLSRGASMVFRALFPVENIRDFTSGYRGYRADLVRSAHRQFGDRLIEERGFACMVELLLKLRHWSPDIREVPMVLQYDRKLSPSKLKLGRTLLQYLKLAMRDRLCPPPVNLVHAR